MHYAKAELSVDDGSESPRGRHLDIERVPPAGRISGIICDETPAMVFTHFWGGRTVPCLRQCEACDAHNRRDWHGYLMIYQASTSKVIIAEITEACRDTLRRFLAQHKTTRGARVSLKRRGEARNGKVSIEIMRAIPSVDLPEPIDLMDWLCHLWGGGGRHGTAVADTSRADAAADNRITKYYPGENGHAH